MSYQLRTVNESLVSELALALNISATTARVLVGRKITSVAEAENFLNSSIQDIHDPFLLKDMDKAVERLTRAIYTHEAICIYGDYDVDGAVGTSLLLIFLQDMGVRASFYIPNRLSEGYSLNDHALRKLKNQGVGLIVTVDNGIMAVAEVGLAQSLGLDVIITDHHQTGPILPPASAVVNPQRSDCPYPFKGICGAGVAFKLALALRQTLRRQGFFDDKPEPNLKSYLDLLAVATVCDMVPLTDENRFFVKEGLRHLEVTKRPGLKALMAVSRLTGPPSATDLGFRLGPRINACGRLEDASLGVLMLTSDDDESALKYAKILDQLNQDRRDLEQNMAEEALSLIEHTIDLTQTLGVVVFEKDWHVGVVGIVASRVVEKIHRPTFILCQTESGEIKGSGRSVGKVSLVKALHECAQHLKKYGGHEAAAGVTLEPENRENFIRDFDAAIKKQMSFHDLKSVVLVDDDLTRAEINARLVNELSRLEPFGMGNAKPLFVAKGLSVNAKKVVGQKHLKLEMGHGKNKVFDAIAFGKADSLVTLNESADVLFGLEVNTFRDVARIQLVVKEFV
jgi:single-stranded-DNA-specific exonuclease